MTTDQMQTTSHQIRLSPPPEPLIKGHLHMGGTSRSGEEIAVDSRSLWRGGQPWLPVMGEFHYSRYPRASWETELRKMKAGGITLVGTYVFWILHEERRGHYRWDGDCDLREFVRLCGDLGLEVVARIGPWGHGESRNGAFPDWLLMEDCAPRTDDPSYLEIVRPWYAEIARQLYGQFWAEGGPVIAVQIENELYDQAEHLRTLKRLAQEAGFDVPLWTVTGWGRAEIPRDEFIPLFGGYPEAAWDKHDAGWARQSRLHYFFTHVRDDHTIGSDLRRDSGDDASSGTAAAGNVKGATGPDLERYPFATCELGSGMYTAYHRRPRIAPEDVAAISLVKLGSGSSWQGYYMYHGGTQRVGELSTMQESHATDYPNDCPVLTYDFQAPLGEFGQVRRSYTMLRQQANWLAAEGHRLARMTPYLPDDGPSDIDDRDRLRWSVRADDESGYVFVNNHQPVDPLSEHHDVRFTIERLGGRAVVLPSNRCTITPGAFFAWPLRLQVAGAALSATAQVLTRTTVGDRPVLILGATPGVAVELQVEGGEVTGPVAVAPHDAAVTLIAGLEPARDCRVTVTGPTGTVDVIVLDTEDAQRLSVVDGKVWLADGPVIAGRSGPALVIDETATSAAMLTPNGWQQVDVPGLDRLPDAGIIARRPAGPARDIPQGGPLGRATAPKDADFAAAATWQIDTAAFADLLDAPGEPSGLDDDEVLIVIDYIGDVARLCAGDRLLADHFWYGDPWEIGLRRFGADALRAGLRLEVLPLRHDAPVYFSPGLRPHTTEDGSAVELREVRVHRRRGAALTIDLSSPC